MTESSPPPIPPTFPPYDISGREDPRFAGGPSWELRHELGGLRAAVMTVKEVLFEPAATFASARRAGGLASPILFALYMGTFFGILAALIDHLTNSAASMAMARYMDAVLPTTDPSETPEQMRQFREWVQWLAERRMGFGFLSILSVLVWASVMPFITSVIVHFCLILVGGAKEDFEATFRVSAYTFGASAILLIIPFCGPTLVYNCWRIIAIIVGIREIHRIESWRATLGVILPHIVAACCCLGFIFFAFSAIMRQLQQ